MPSDSSVIARQPIVDRLHRIVGYELLCRKEGKSFENNARVCTSNVLINALNYIGIEQTVGEHTAFINIESKYLLTGILHTLPKERFVFELSANMKIVNKEIEAIKALYDEGYRFALDCASGAPEYLKNFEPVMGYITYVKFDTTATDYDALKQNIEFWNRFELIAHKVEDRDTMTAYELLGFDLFQGFFLGQPEALVCYSLPIKRDWVIELYRLLQEDVPLAKVSAFFNTHPELEFHLLKYIGSIVKLDLRHVLGIGDILAELGKDKLIQWVLMNLYAKTPELYTQQTTRVLSDFYRQVEMNTLILDMLDDEHRERFTEQLHLLTLVHHYSLMFDEPIDEIFEKFILNSELKRALQTQNSILGKLWKIAESVDRMDESSKERLLAMMKPNFKYTPSQLVKALNLHCWDVSA